MKLSNNGKWVIGLLALFAVAFLAVLWLWTKDAQEMPERKANTLISEASGVLGEELKVVYNAKDLNGDGKQEIFAYRPATRDTAFAPRDSNTFWAQAFIVLQLQGRGSKHLLYGGPKALATPAGPVLPNASEAPYGYLVAYEPNRKDTSLRIQDLYLYKADARGQPASDELYLSWDADQRRFVLQNP
jgi:hypothetical protein